MFRLEGCAVESDELLYGARPWWELYVAHTLAVLPSAKVEAVAVDQELGVVVELWRLHRFRCKSKFGMCTHQLLDVGGGLIAVRPRVLDGEERAVRVIELAALEVDEQRREWLLGEV